MGATKIGCDNFVYAPLTSDSLDAIQFDTVVEAPGVIAININPNASIDTLFVDDGPGETATALGMIEVEIQKNYLTTKQKADILGHTIDAKGGLVYGAQDVPPWIAIGFRSLKSNGKYRYVWLYKGKFSEPADQNETKGDSVNFNTETITGQFVKVEKKYTIGGKVKQPWKYELDEDDEGVDAALLSTWFSKVQEPAVAGA